MGLPPLVLYQSEHIEREGPTLLWAWLHLLAQLAGHLLPSVYRTFHTFLDRPTMHAPGLRLLCRTWQNQDRAFRKFQSALLAVYEKHATLPSTVLIAVAVSVRDCARVDPRGLELIALLSQLVQQKDHPEANSLALQSFTYLCLAGCVEFATAWAINEKDVLPDSHPLVEQRMNFL